MKSLFKNIILTTVLAGLVLWIAYESAKRGVFRGIRTTPKIEADSSLAAVQPIDPTPTPLPMHFPSVEDDDLNETKRGYVGLLEAYKICWPNLTSGRLIDDSAITIADLEALFGKIKKREILEQTDDNQRLGLLFGTTVFSAGAAGSAVESGGSTLETPRGLTSLQLRAAGRMLHCENATHCECLSSIAP